MMEKIGAVKLYRLLYAHPEFLTESGFKAANDCKLSMQPHAKPFEHETGFYLSDAQLRQLCADVISSFLEEAGKDKTVDVTIALNKYLASPEFNKALEGV